MAKTLKINGIDFTGYFPREGYSVSYESIQGSNAGLMLDGSYTEDEIAQKATVTLNCMPLNEVQLATLLAEINGTLYPMVYFFDPLLASYRTMQVRRTLTTQKYRGFGGTGVEYWTGTVVTLKER